VHRSPLGALPLNANLQLLESVLLEEVDAASLSMKILVICTVLTIALNTRGIFCLKLIPEGIDWP